MLECATEWNGHTPWEPWPAWSWARWWLDSKIERTCDTRDRKIDDLNAVLRDTVLEFKGEIGELRGTVRPPTPSQD